MTKQATLRTTKQATALLDFTPELAATTYASQRPDFISPIGRAEAISATEHLSDVHVSMDEIRESPIFVETFPPELSG